jgi:hypothetical protein
MSLGYTVQLVVYVHLIHLLHGIPWHKMYENRTELTISMGMTLRLCLHSQTT